MSKKITTEEFIEKAKEIHSDKYDYSKVSYVSAKTKVCIICKKHGEFWQRANHHLEGRGCPECGRVSQWVKRNKMTTEEFIRKVKTIHNNKYDYSKVNYINSHVKVCIICPEHGEFWQEANSHIKGYGCPICGKKATWDNREKITTKDFINKAKLLHGDKYDYSKVNYIHHKTKVCIICPEHGEFWQTPSNHLLNHGCPICKESKLEKEVAKLLDESNIDYIRFKHFKWLGKQSLDFYLPKYDIAIECQGEQHFKPIDYFGGYKRFQVQKHNDLKKKKLCADKNINMLYINYNEDKNEIKEKIKNIL